MLARDDNIILQFDREAKSVYSMRYAERKKSLKVEKHLKYIGDSIQNKWR